jgi:hypothetical protein
MVVLRSCFYNNTTEKKLGRALAQELSFLYLGATLFFEGLGLINSFLYGLIIFSEFKSSMREVYL